MAGPEKPQHDRLPQGAASEATHDAHIRLLLQSAPIALLAFNAAGIITLYEGAGLAPLGKRPGARLGQHISQVGADHLRRAERILAGESFTEIVRFRGRVLEMQHAPVRDETEEIAGGLILALDRTEEHRARERFRRVVDRGSDPVLLHDAELRFTHASEAACRLLGRNRKDLVGRTFAEIVVPADRNKCSAIRVGLQESGGVASEVLRVDRRDGVGVPLETHTVALGDGTYYTRARDLRPWIESERAARTSASHLESVLRSAPLTLLAVDAAGFVQLYDGKDRPLFGVADPEHLVGRHYTAFPAHTADFRQRMERTLAGESFSVERSVGDLRLRVYHSPLRDAEGNPAGATMIGFDITEERALEAQVRQAQRMEAVGNLAAGVSHDFNNLLTVVLANLDVARFQEGPARESALAQAAEAARSASDLSRQLLDIGRANMSPRGAVELASTVLDVLSLLDRSLGDEVRTIAHVEPGVGVRGNPAQIRQVLMNLALNAAEAMPDGGLVEVVAAPGQPPASLDLPPRDEGYIELSVHDDGVGMDQRTADQMWDPFFTTKPHGTGLGTAVVWGIVREHDGRVLTESSPGAGTTIRIFLPAASVEASPRAANDGPTRLPTIGPAPAPTVLVVDDLTPLRVATRHILEAAGYNVREAPDGIQALAIVRSEPIDLVVLDCSMPGMSGREVYDELQNLAQPPRVLFTTGYTADALQGLEPTPMWSLLPKPFDAATLLETSAAMLHGRAA